MMVPCNFQNFDLLSRPTSNCDFLHLCRLENLAGTFAGELHMSGWAGGKMVVGRIVTRFSRKIFPTIL